MRLGHRIEWESPIFLSAQSAVWNAFIVMQMQPLDGICRSYTASALRIFFGFVRRAAWNWREQPIDVTNNSRIVIHMMKIVLMRG